MKYGKNLFYKESRKPSIAATDETQIRKGRWTGGNSVKARVGGGKVENGWFGGRSEGVGEENGCAQLYAFTRFYTLFLSGYVTKGGNGVPE